MHTLLRQVSKALVRIYPSAEAAAIARLLLSEGLNWNTSLLYTGKYTDLSAEEKNKLQIFQERLLAHEPIQYILGSTVFGGRAFHVAPGVLIPRPETEELVQEIVTDWHLSPGLSVLDIGAGSGCIAISLSLELQDAAVGGWDVSAEALRVARKNNTALGARVSFELRDVLREDADEQTGAASLSILVSNPPYVLDSERKEMEAHVLDWEPPQALFVPDSDPLLFYRRIALLGRRSLKEGGMLYFEINPRFAAELAELLGQAGYYEVQLRKDRYGKNRIIKGKR